VLVIWPGIGKLAGCGVECPLSLANVHPLFPSNGQTLGIWFLGPFFVLEFCLVMSEGCVLITAAAFVGVM